MPGDFNLRLQIILDILNELNETIHSSKYTI
jgi:hypothetical protein